MCAGDHASAVWRQGDHAGRALLRRSGTDWSVVLCAGDALTDRTFLVEAGIGRADDDALVGALTNAERTLSDEISQRMTRFKNVVRMRGR